MRRRELADLRAQFGEYGIKGTRLRHQTLLAVTNINYAHTATVDEATAPISESPEKYSPIRGLHFSNTQCGAVRGRIPLCSCLQARFGVCDYGGRFNRTNLGGPGWWISPIGGPDLRIRNICEAACRCITLGSRRHARNNHHSRR